MKQLRFLLFPIAAIYWLVTSLRNYLYSKGIMRGYIIPNKSIVVGNLSVGGTGKSPHVDLLIKLFLEQNKSIATLSRGYGRKTKGFLEVETTSLPADVGDEPLMFKVKNHDKINVSVCEDRTEGVRKINELHPETDIILLDDAFQHQKVKAGLNILLTDCSSPYYNDFILPMGDLREPRSGVSRADIIIITKCPKELSQDEKERIRKKIGQTKKPLFFSSIEYGNINPISEDFPSDVDTVLLVTGIANPKPLIEHLSKSYQVEHLNFKDHHNFTAADITSIHKKFDSFASRKKAIITTEKDYMRLKDFNEIYSENYHWAFQPIEILLDEPEKFKTLINTYAN